MKRVIDEAVILREIKKEAEMGFVSVDTVERVLDTYGIAIPIPEYERLAWGREPAEPPKPQTSIGGEMVKRMIAAYEKSGHI